MIDEQFDARPNGGLRVLIIGAGLSGLLLAHGLVADGVDVEVFERRSETGDDLPGFGIHLHPRGVRAIRDCLPDENWKAFDAAAGHAGATIRFYDEQLRLMADYHDGFERRALGRLELREILLKGLDTDGHGVMRWSRQFTGYEQLPGGRVRANFADGTHADGDVLVGADGANSAVRRQYLPDLKREDVGTVTVAGRTPLTDRLAAQLPPALIDGAPNSVVPSHREWMFVSAWRLGENAPDASGDYIVWALSAATSSFAEDIETWSGPKLHALVRERISGWAPQLRLVVDEAEAETISPIALRSMPQLPAWPSSVVTLVGDAAHNMTPLAGIGANTALRDAAILRTTIADAIAGRKGLVEAIADYEDAMREYANDAIAQSTRNAKNAGSEGWLARFAFRTVLRIAQAAPALKRRMFATAE